MLTIATEGVGTGACRRVGEKGRVAKLTVRLKHTGRGPEIQG